MRRDAGDNACLPPFLPPGRLFPAMAPSHETPSSTRRDPIPPPEALERGQWLLLTPTEPEAKRLAQAGLVARRTGFGPVAAAVRSAALLAQTRPQRVLLLGCAGSYDAARLAPGQAAVFGRFSLGGIGVGQGPDHRSINELGWEAWTATEEHASWPATLVSASEGAHLVSVCAASAHPGEAAAVRTRYPDALAEDMEAYAVAAACREAGVPFHCMRGISNVVGERDRAHWKLAASLDEVARLARERFPQLVSLA